MNKYMHDNRPKIGIGVLVINEGKLLLGERIHAHGANTWCPPGGHLEMWETPQQCAVRELREEAGLVAAEVEIGPWTNDFFREEGKHYITLYTMVRDFKGEPVVNESDKCKSWRWFPLDNLPQNLFLSLKNLLKRHGISCLTT